MGRDISIFQIGESPYQYGAHSNLGTNINTRIIRYAEVPYCDRKPIIVCSKENTGLRSLSR